MVVAIRKHYLESAQSIDSIKNSTYWAIKGIADYEYESYLSSIGNRHHRRALSQFRTGSHWLEIQRGRFARPTVPREQRLCRLCDMHAVENENHALFDCPAIARLRQKHGIHIFMSIESLFQQNHPTIPISHLAFFLEECRLAHSETV